MFTAALPPEADATGGNQVDDQDDNVTSEVAELTFHQRLELSMKSSQCPFSPAITPPSDADRQLQATIKTKMTLFSTTGHRGSCLQQAFDCLMTVPATSVEAESILSCKDFVL